MVSGGNKSRCVGRRESGYGALGVLIMRGCVSLGMNRRGVECVGMVHNVGG